MSELQNQEEALLKLKIISAEDLKPPTFLTNYKTFMLIWIDPRHKQQTTKTLTTSTRNPTYYNHNLTFPLSLQTLQNPSSHITLQIISPSSPISHTKRVIGSTSMLVSDVKFDEEVFTLQLWRPSGRAHGLIRVSAKVEIRDLGFCCVTGIPFQIQSPPLDFDPMELRYTHQNVVPSAPPTESEDSVVETNIKNVHVEQLDVDCGSASSCNRSNSSSTVSNGCSTEAASAVPSEGTNVLRSLLVGFLGGAVAVATVLIGSNAS